MEKLWEIYWLRPGQDLYKIIKKIPSRFQKRRSRLYGHFYRMEKDRLTKLISEYHTNKKTKTAFFKNVQ